MWVIAVLALVALVAYVVYTRMNELFVLSVRGGRVLVLRGRIPNNLHAAFASVASRAKLERATIKAVKGQRHARLVFSGVDEGTAQRMRNAFGIHPIQALRAARLPDTRNVGQLLGIAWLAWMLSGR